MISSGVIGLPVLNLSQKESGSNTEEWILSLQIIR